MGWDGELKVDQFDLLDDDGTPISQVEAIERAIMLGGKMQTDALLRFLMRWSTDVAEHLGASRMGHAHHFLNTLGKVPFAPCARRFSHAVAFKWLHAISDGVGSMDAKRLHEAASYLAVH